MFFDNIIFMIMLYQKHTFSSMIARQIYPSVNFASLPSCILQILALNGSEIGKVTKVWSGAVQEIMTNADNYKITCKFTYYYTLV